MGTWSNIYRSWGMVSDTGESYVQDTSMAGKQSGHFIFLAVVAGSLVLMQPREDLSVLTPCGDMERNL